MNGPAPSAELGLNAFEHLMWADDRLSTPMTFYLRLEFAGALDQAKFRAAIAASLHRHPLLQSVAIGDPKLSGKKLRWQRTSDQPYVDWVEDGRSFKTPGRAVGIDLSREIGCRFFVRVDGEKTLVLAQFHHSSVDAKGGSLFLEDALAHYHASSENEDPHRYWRKLAAESLAERDQFHLSKKDLRRRRRLDWERIRMYFRLRPEIMWHAKQPADARANLARSYDIEIDAAEFEQLKNYSKSRGCTINDVLLRDLFLTLNKWNDRHVKKRGSRCIRLAMAIDMRRPGDETMPAANVVSMCFLDRRPQDMSDREALLDDVRNETRHIKRHYLGMALIRAARIFSSLRGGFAILMRPNKLFPCHSTAVLSNLGLPLAHSNLPKRNDGFIVGDTKLIGFSLLPPFRVNTPLAVGVGTVGNKLRVAMHYNADVLTADQMRTLGELMRAELDTTLSYRAPEKTLIPMSPKPANGGPLWALPIGKNVAPRAPDQA